VSLQYVLRTRLPAGQIVRHKADLEIEHVLRPEKIPHHLPPGKEPRQQLSLDDMRLVVEMYNSGSQLFVKQQLDSFFVIRNCVRFGPVTICNGGHELGQMVKVSHRKRREAIASPEGSIARVGIRYFGSVIQARCIPQHIYSIWTSEHGVAVMMKSLFPSLPSSISTQPPRQRVFRRVK
jgi:hypothetical protein